MNLAPLSLNVYCITELSVIARMGYKSESALEAKLSELKVDHHVQNLSDGIDGEWQVSLKVCHQPAPETNFPYEFKIVVVGSFEFLDKPATEDDAKRFLSINGASMLYGIAREIIRMNTSNGPWGHIMLPTVSFYEPKKEDSVDETKKQELEKN